MTPTTKTAALEMSPELRQRIADLLSNIALLPVPKLYGSFWADAEVHGQDLLDVHTAAQRVCELLAKEAAKELDQ